MDWEVGNPGRGNFPGQAAEQFAFLPAGNPHGLGQIARAGDPQPVQLGVGERLCFQGSKVLLHGVFQMRDNRPLDD